MISPEFLAELTRPITKDCTGVTCLFILVVRPVLPIKAILAERVPGWVARWLTHVERLMLIIGHASIALRSASALGWLKKPYLARALIDAQYAWRASFNSVSTPIELAATALLERAETNSATDWSCGLLM